MKTSLRGHLLPESADDAKELAQTGALKFARCVGCGRSLAGPDAAHSLLGWRETQISGECEECFEALFADMEDEE